MSDGTRIAIDVHLPSDVDETAQLPTILHQTRYWRSVDIRFPFDRFVDGRFVLWGGYRRHFVERGYAWVDVDVRGTGASFGTWRHSYWEREVADGAEIVDWIVAQPWSNGRVGAWGVSYAGGAAEFLLANRHPAVEAAAPTFSPFDVYDEIGFPGGIRSRWYIREWAEVNRRLDRNRPPVDTWLARLAARGVRPVDGADGRARLEEALEQRSANVDVEREAEHVTHRDDPSPNIPTVDRMSPHAHADRIAGAGVPVYSYSGWFDGAYAHAAIRRFLTYGHPDDKLTIGPWDHGGAHNVSPAVRADTRFRHRDELLKFFDTHLLDLPTGLREEPPVHVYVMGAEEWRSADAWPPPDLSIRRYVLGPNQTLAPASGPAGTDRHEVDPTHGSGTPSRWTALVGPTESASLYPDWNARSRTHLAYTSAPLPAAVDVVGHPMVTLHVAFPGSDGAIFAYLEDVAPGGESTYVTEGRLRAIHRNALAETPPYVDAVPVRTYQRSQAEPVEPGEVVELTFALLPTAYRFAEGHAIRVSFTGADADYFAAVPSAGDFFDVHHGGASPSTLTVPVWPAAMESVR